MALWLSNSRSRPPVGGERVHGVHGRDIQIFTESSGFLMEGYPKMCGSLATCRGDRGVGSGSVVSCRRGDKRICGTNYIKGSEPSPAQASSLLLYNDPTPTFGNLPSIHPLFRAYLYKPTRLYYHMHCMVDVYNATNILWRAPSPFSFPPPKPGETRRKP